MRRNVFTELNMTGNAASIFDLNAGFDFLCPDTWGLYEREPYLSNADHTAFRRFSGDLSI